MTTVDGDCRRRFSAGVTGDDGLCTGKNGSSRMTLAQMVNIALKDESFEELWL